MKQRMTAQNAFLVVTVLLAIVRNNNIILVRRKKLPYKDLWGLPGGKVEFGENISEAASREAKEETGLECHFDRVCCVASEIVYKGNNKKPAHHFVLIVCLLHPVSSKTRGTDEGEPKWFPLGQVSMLRKSMIPSDRKFISILKLHKDRTYPFYEVYVRVAEETKCVIRRI